jgi:2-oxoglutarate ferredoxin oxidoreductase subunit alpha
MAKQLLKGNIAFAEAAIRAGCEVYFGYPITPQTELLEHMARRMPELGRVFLQAESEVAAVNMVYGAAAAGAKVMTSSSSPGISLMQEGFSYMAGSNVPAVVIDIMRGGPGLGNIQPSQADYYQVTKTAGHGDFHPIVLAPATVQEAIDLTTLAFDLAEKYRTLVFVIADGAIGQMMEPAELPEMRPLPEKRPEWAVTGAKGRAHNVISSLYMNADALETFNLELQSKLHLIQASEVRYETDYLEDAEVVVVAFGTAARVALTAVKRLRAEGLPVGLFRPITLWPFPEEQLAHLAEVAPAARAVLVVEMNAGQMVHDVREAVGGQFPVRFTGRMGGIIPLPEEIESTIRSLLPESAQTAQVEVNNGRVARN